MASFEQRDPGTFALTERGQLLRAGHPASMRNYVLLFCGEQVWQSWGDLEYSIRTGQSAWERRYGPPFGPGFMTPEFSEVFNAAMAEGTKVADRCEQQPGDFFAEVPGGVDAYLLKSVIHDWNDARACVILANCRAAMSPAATLMLIEPVTSDQPGRQAPFSVSYSDLNMLLCTSGRERTEDEFRGLLTAAGFAVRRIAPCPPTGYSIIEAVPVQEPAQR